MQGSLQEGDLLLKGGGVISSVGNLYVLTIPGFILVYSTDIAKLKSMATECASIDI